MDEGRGIYSVAMFQKKRDILSDVSFLLVRRFCCAKTKAASGGP